MYRRFHYCLNLFHFDGNTLNLSHKKRTDDEAKGYEGLFHKVYDLNRIQGMPLKQVADILGYSEAYIKNISCEINKKM